MKHATTSSLKRIESILKELRNMPELRERANGVFYLKSAAFVHFHEDPAGLFADLKEKGEWNRYPVNALKEVTLFLKRARTAPTKQAMHKRG